VTITVQLAPAASCRRAAQVPPRENAAALAPPTAMALSSKAAAPVLFTVMLRGAETDPAVSAPKSMAVADRPTVPCATAPPVPLRATLLLPPAASWLMTTDAVRAPSALGLKPTCTSQCAPAATTAPFTQVPPSV
jgi:hypothetical protein